MPRVLSTWGLITGPRQSAWPAHCLAAFPPWEEISVSPTWPFWGVIWDCSPQERSLKSGRSGDHAPTGIPVFSLTYRASIKISHIIQTSVVTLGYFNIHIDSSVKNGILNSLTHYVSWILFFQLQHTLSSSYPELLIPSMPLPVI